MMCNLAIVIVNYRTADLALDCVRSLDGNVPAGTRIVLVDNASNDGSADMLRAATKGTSIELLCLADNRGFAAGNNAALRRLLSSMQPPDNVLLLNPDTIVERGAVDTLVRFMNSNPGVGIAGSRLEHGDGAPQRSAFRFPGIASELERGLRLGLVSRMLSRFLVAPPVRNERHPTDWVSGASMIVRRQVFEQIGLLDEGFFLYFEETDFCLRAMRAGWGCWYVPESRVVHLVGQSSGLKDDAPSRGRMPTYWFASRGRYFAKNHGWLYRRLADLTWALAFACWRVRRRLQGKPDHDPPRLLWEFCRFALHGNFEGRNR